MKMSENDYNDLRKRNIAEKDAIFAEIFNDLEIKKFEEKYDDAKNAKKSTFKLKSRRIRSIDKFKRSEPELSKRYNTRSRSRSVYEDKGEEKENYLTEPGRECDADKEQNNDNLSKTKIKKQVYNRNKVTYNLNNISSANEITDEMLTNVVTTCSSKVYCSVNGRSCHQCRHKTLDTKTVCRSGECFGLRGQFCGHCLRVRYGEDIITALKDPDWVCPPCRGLCNCSACRKKNGLFPTGNLTVLIKKEGYSSVMDYLQFVETDDT